MPVRSQRTECYCKAMVQSEITRRAYLEALGVTQWETRTQRGATSAVAAPAGRAISAGETAGVDAADSGGVAAMDWDALERTVSACISCGLHATRTKTVFGVGNRAARWLFVGEAPGADEDRQGEPFVGRAGQLLNAMLEAIGLRREEVYIANVLKCRPPGNRDPQPREVECCEPFLIRQIALIQPRLIVALGRHAAHSLLKTEAPLARLRGQRLSYHGTPLVVTFHPAYLLRSPADKRRAWDDLCLARSLVESAG